MEKDKKQNSEDIFLRKYLKEVELQKPSIDFTSNVMDVLAKEEKLALAKNEPLISTKVWLLVASFVGVCFYFVFKDNKSIGVSFPEVDLSFLNKIEMPNLLGNLSVSNSMIYIFGFFTVMIFVQIFFLKNHFV